MFVGVSTALTAVRRVFHPFVREGLKLYYRFTGTFNETTPDFLLDGSTSFDGTNDYISMSFNESGNYTISAWFKIDTTQASGIVEWGDQDDGERRSLFLWNGGSGAYKLYSSTYGSNIAGGTSLSTGVWYHGAVTVDVSDGSAKVYLNGSLDGTGTNDINSFSGTTGYIGKTGNNEFFKGDIANVGIWNRALSASEIESIYWRGSYSELKGTELTNLVSWYDLDSTSLGSELITNGDNESAKAGLSDIRASSSQSNEQAQSGTYSYKAVANSANDTHYSRVTLTANKSHKVTGYAYLPSGQTISSLKVGYDNSGDNQFSKYTISTTNSWVAFEVDIPANASYSYFTIGGASGSYENNYWYIDSISVKEVQAEDKQGSNEGSIIGATTNTDSYSGESPFKPRIQDKATPKLAVQLSEGSTSFDGTDDYISIPAVSLGNPDTGWTVGVWAKSTDSGDDHIIFSNSSGGSISSKYGITNQHIWFSIYADQGSGATWTNYEASTPNVLDGQWHYLTWVMETDSTDRISMYVDGSLVDADNSLGDSTGGQINAIGRGHNFTDAFQGELSNFARYTTALTQNQIQKLMFTEKYSGLTSDLKTNLISWYDLGSTSLGSELVTNGDCSSDSFSKEGGWTYDSTNDQYDSNQLSGGNAITQSIGIVAYASYEVTFTVSNYVSGGVKPNVGAYTSGTPRTANGTYTETIQANHASSNALLYIMANSGFVGSVDDISAKAVSAGDLQGSNDGTIVGATTTTGYTSSPHGVVDPLNFGEVYSGRALSFDGSNDYVSCGVSGIPSGNSARTMMLWIKQDQATGSNEGIFGFGETGGSEANETFEFYNDNSGVRVHYASGNSGGTTNLGQGVWRHLCATHDGSTVSVYIDGVLDHTDSKTLSTVADFCRIGANSYDSSPSEYLDGSVSNIKVFNIALTQSQIQELYRNPEQVLPTGASASNLKLDLPMQEGSGSYVYDGSGNQNHGTISGATWATGEKDGYQSSLVRSNTPMVFDGSDDYIDCGTGLGSNIGDNYSGSLTFSMWFNTDVTSGDDGLFNISSFSGTHGEMGIVIDANSIKFHLNNGGWTRSFAFTDTNNWHHLICVYKTGNESQSVMYLDGSLQSSSTTGSFPSASDMDFSGLKTIIGGYVSSSYTLDGLINEVAVWDVALDADAVTALYGSGTPLLPTSDSGNYDNSDNLVGYWRNDGNTTWTDRTPLGAYGSELITNGGFDDASTTGWETATSGTNEFTVSATGDVCTVSTASTAHHKYFGTADDGTSQGYGFSIISGKAYQISFDFTQNSGTSPRIRIRKNGIDGGNIADFEVAEGAYTNNTVETKTLTFTAGDYSGGTPANIGYLSFDLGASTATNFTIDNVSVKKYRGGNDGTATNATTSIVIPEGSTEGRDSQGFLLTDTTSISNGIRVFGSEYISIQDSEILTFGDGVDDKPFSIESWIKMNDATSFRVVGKGAFNTAFEYTFGVDSANKLGLWLGDESVASCYLGKRTSSTVTTNEGSWIHACATYDGTGASSGIKVYINGSAQSIESEEGSAGSYVAMENLGATINIGEWNSTYADGLIDEVRIYQKELSASEVLKNYNNGKSAHQ